MKSFYELLIQLEQGTGPEIGQAFSTGTSQYALPTSPLSKQQPQQKSGQPAAQPDYGENATPDAKLQELLQLDYPAFVQKLGGFIKDPKFLQYLQSAAGEGDRIQWSEGPASVATLKPTQNEIDITNSLSYALGSAKDVEAYLAGGTVAVAGKKIVTGGGGTFIVDGHHRWSQVYCLNPECQIEAMDMSNITQPLKALKTAQLAIAATSGGVPVENVQGQNLLTIDEETLKNWVKGALQTPFSMNATKHIGKLVIEQQGPAQQPVAQQPVAQQQPVLAAFAKYGIGDIEQIADHIWKNVQLMQKNNKPLTDTPRGLMPQTDKAAGKTPGFKKSLEGNVKHTPPGRPAGAVAPQAGYGQQTQYPAGLTTAWTQSKGDVLLEYLKLAGINHERL